MGYRETGWCGMEWVYLAQDKDPRKALMDALMNLLLLYLALQPWVSFGLLDNQTPHPGWLLSF
jgi:hypothetical protein